MHELWAVETLRPYPLRPRFIKSTLANLNNELLPWLPERISLEGGRLQLRQIMPHALVVVYNIGLRTRICLGLTSVLIRTSCQAG